MSQDKGSRRQRPAPPSRVRVTAALEEPVTRVRYVSAERGRLLRKLGIVTVRDLLCWYPSRYLDMSKVTTIAQAPIGESVTVVGTLDNVGLRSLRRGGKLVEASLVDETGVMNAVWFSQPWVTKRLRPGMLIAFSGKVGFRSGFKQMSSPFSDVLYDPAEDERRRGDAADPTGLVLPVHHLTAGLSPSWMRRMVSGALEDIEGVLDPLPPAIRERYGFMGRGRALCAMHFPRDMAERAEARRRLAYEEILRLQLHLLMRRERELSGVTPFRHKVDGPVLGALVGALPFALTVEQQGAVHAILAEMAAPTCMNRLIEGDVGTGKTVVAAHALAAVADSSFQAVMMGPTGVLVQQYGAKLGPLLESCGVSWALLTAATPAAERKRILSACASGELQVLFGTHALLQPDVVFSCLSLVVIDEQQRFGVGQRSLLAAKGPGADLLTMTATPIPRTLALALYGDLDVTYLRNKPRKGAKVTTVVLDRKRRDKAYDAIRKTVRQGRQAYIICPLVGVSEKRGKPEGDFDEDVRAKLSGRIAAGDEVSDAAAAEAMAASLKRQIFPEYEVGLLTGRMSPSEKEQVMARFAAGGIDILVSTTVVEVGVDVPNATVMLVEDAELFGLAQLHQLRGRVGRGEQDGTVFLLSDPRNKKARERLGALERTDDGIELAELDLKSRREGDVLGFRQHGAGTLKLVELKADRALIERARSDARRMLAADPLLSQPGHASLSRELSIVFAGVDEHAVSGG